MEHEQIREWLYRKHEELAESEQELLEAHLENCEDCRTYALNIQTVEVELRRAFHARWDPVSVPELELRKVVGRSKASPALEVIGLAIVLLLVFVLRGPLTEFITERATPTKSEAAESYPNTTPTGHTVVVLPTEPIAEDRQIVFVSRRDGNREIYVISVPVPQTQEGAQGTGLKNLTQNPAQDYAPVWSPDGERIAFVSDRDGQPGLFVMQADGSQVTSLSLVPDAQAYGEASWSPDGQQLAVQLILEYPFTGEAYTQIYLVAVDSSGATALSNTEFPLSNLEPKWSPVGNRIASRTLGIVQAFPRGAPQAEPEQIRLSRGLENVGTLAWSPDGSHLAYFSSCQYCVEGKDLSPAVHLIEADGNNSQVLYAFDEQDLHGIGLCWSPDGNLLLLLVTEIQDGVQHLYLISADGSSMALLADLPPGAMESVPSWSPDGRRLVYALEENGEAGIYILDLDDRLSGDPDEGLVRLTVSARGDSSPRWQP